MESSNPGIKCPGFISFASFSLPQKKVFSSQNTPLVLINELVCIYPDFSLLNISFYLLFYAAEIEAEERG